MKYLLLLFFPLIIIGCEKNKTDEPYNKNAELVHFYSADANSKDAVALTVLDTPKTAALIGYAAFGNDKLHTRINSFVFGSRSDDYHCNLILDENRRPKLFYLTAKNGENDHVLLSFSYPAGETVVYNLYYYDWLTQRDSLLQQQLITINGFSSVNYNSAAPGSAYWERTASELKTIEDFIKQVFNDKIVIKDISDARFTTKNLADFLGRATMSYSGVRPRSNLELSSSLLKLQEKAENWARIQQRLSSGTPVKLSDFTPVDDPSFFDLVDAKPSTSSPTNPDKPAPNPKGTPQNPVGIIANYFIGNWYQTSGNESYNNYYYKLNVNGFFIASRNNTFTPLLYVGDGRWGFYSDNNNVSYINLGPNNWKIKSFNGNSFVANRTNFNDNIDVFFKKF